MTGAESTGKTTLAHELGECFQAPVVYETLRQVVAAVGRPPTEGDLEHAARIHIAADDRMRSSGHELVIYDTDLATLMIYWEHYFQNCPAWMIAEAESRAPDRYLLAADDFPWVSDVQRDSPETRESLQRVFETRIPDLAPVSRIRGSLHHRIDSAVRIIRSDLTLQSSATGDRR